MIFTRAGVMFILLFWASGCGKNSAPPFLDLPIYFTCDTHGRLEPCGCFVGQFGGLSRLKTVLDAEAPPGALRVDVGDAAAGREDYDLIEYRYMLRGFAAMNYDVLNIGAREAQFTAAQLRELKTGSPTPIISANLLDKNTRQPIFDSYRIVQRDGFRVAIIGVLDPRAAENPGDGLVVGEMESAVERSLAELRGKADLIVLLAFADEAALGRLAQEFYECKVILGGKVSQPAQELVHQNRSLIYFVTNESRALGILRLRLQRAGALEATGNEIRLLHDHIPQADSFHQLMQGYREEIRHARLAVDDPNNLAADAVPGVRAVASYTGTEKCLACHPSAAAVWKDSPHARAFATLLEPKADADPKCIGCHTIGFGRSSGYQRDYGAGKLVNVGCESCHGPGSLHVRQREGDATVNFTFRPLGAGDCAKCHYGEFSRPFNWDEFWPAIKHGKEPGTPVAVVK
jgi:Cytochrome c554 and c-prime